ncbi:MAG: DEAD/DEAH box helicase [Fimbriimonas sp.]
MSERVPILLRPYQEEAKQAVLAAFDAGITRPMVVMATGTGKTTLFGGVIGAMAEHDPSFTALVLAHRQELLAQAAGRIASMCPDLGVGIERAEERCDPGVRCAVASVQSIGMAASKRLDWLAPMLIVTDESHHAPADTYQNVYRRFGVYDEGGALHLGVTATDHRLDNMALHSRDGATFQRVVYRYSISRAIRDGWLTDLRGFRVECDLDLSKVKTVAGDYDEKQLAKAVNTDAINELALSAWEQHARDRRTIVFCVDVQHALDVAEVFRAKGVSAACVHGGMKTREREDVIAAFRTGEVQVLTNVNIATEGFDCPEAGCVLTLRPTKSWTLYTQMVGRGLRPLAEILKGCETDGSRRAAIMASRKPDCVVIDLVDLAKGHKLGVTPEQGEGVPSLTAMVGLPPELDLEGATILEAAEIFEALPEDIQSVAMRGPIKLRDLKAKTSQIRLLTDVSPAEEAKGAGLYWLKTGEATYRVYCGTFDSGRREAIIEGDLLGNWRLFLKVGQSSREFDLPPSLPQAFRVAEEIVNQRMLGASRFAGKNAAWRQGAVTSAQIRELRRMGAPEDMLAGLDRGKASAMIERLRAIARELGEEAA